MWQSRATVIKRKPKIILDNNQFPVITSLNLGDKGQLLLGGSIDAERLELQEDDSGDNERVIKTIRVLSIKLLENRNTRV